MKLLVIICLEEMQESIARILNDSGIGCMGVMPFNGYRKGNECPALGWFGRGSACEHTDSLLMFTFTESEMARKAIEAINLYNTEHSYQFAPRAYALEVSEFSKLTD